MIIDVHQHIPKRREDWAKSLKVCRLNGVTLVIISDVLGLADYPNRRQIRHANTRSRAFSGLFGANARWLAYLNPQLSDWSSELKRCLDDGAIGIKLWVAFRDKRGRLDNCYPILKAAGKRGLPVLIHTMNPTSPNARGEIDTEEFAFLAKRFPQTNLIAAHVGGNWHEGVVTMRSTGPNAYLDVCGCDPNRGLLENFIDAVGPDRVVFGTDMAGRSFPSQMTKVLFADVDDKVRQKVFWRNAARLFKIDMRQVPKVEPVEVPPAPIDRTTDHLCFSGRWPFFEIDALTPKQLERELKRQGVTSAYVADLGSLFRVDLAVANRQFLASARGCRTVHPLAVVNPHSHDWREVLDGAGRPFAGVLVSPYLHAWPLNELRYAEFFRTCAKRKLPVWINCRLHDWRWRHSGAGFRVVAADELIDFARSAPANRYVFQGAAADAVDNILSLKRTRGDFRFDISKLIDGNGQFARILNAHGPDKLVLGSEWPFRDMRTVPWTADREAALRF